MKRFMLSVLVLVLTLGFLVPSIAQEDVTLRVLWFNDANESDVFLDTIQPYLDENPHIKIDMQVVAFSDYEQKLKVMLTGDMAPDIARVTNNQIPVFLSELEPIAPYIEDIKDVESAFMAASLAFAKNENDEIIAYPTEATANGMIVNKTAFEKAGVDVAEVSKTWTWEEWEEIIKKVIAFEGNPTYGLALDFTPHRFSTLLFEFGGRMMNDDYTAVNFSNEKTVETITWFKRMHDEKIVPESVWLGSENPAELFQAGVVACHIGGSWNINVYAKNIKDFEWMVVVPPKGEIVSSVPGGKFVASFKGSKNKEEAQKLMAWFSEDGPNAKYCCDTFNLSSRIDSSVEYPSNTSDFAAFSEALKATPVYVANEWKNPVLSQISPVIKEQIVLALMGDISPADAAAAIDQKGAEMMK